MDEQERGISLKMMPMSLVLPGSTGKHYLVNLLDTPGQCCQARSSVVAFSSWGSHCHRPAGHINFNDEVTAAMRLADGVLLVVDAVEGVMLVTEKVGSRGCLARSLPDISSRGCLARSLPDISSMCLTKAVTPSELSASPAPLCCGPDTLLCSCWTACLQLCGLLTLSSSLQAIQQACQEGLPISLMISKVDRLITELKIPPGDAYFKIRHIIDEINALIFTHGGGEEKLQVRTMLLCS